MTAFTRAKNQPFFFLLLLFYLFFFRELGTWNRCLVCYGGDEASSLQRDICFNSNELIINARIRSAKQKRKKASA